MKVWPIALGMGAAAGAVAVMMMPRQSTARKLASRAADKVEDAVYNVVDKITSEVEM